MSFNSPSDNTFLGLIFFQVKFARPETDRAKAQRLSSFKYLEKKKAEEPWKTVEFFNPQVFKIELLKLYHKAIVPSTGKAKSHCFFYLKLIIIILDEMIYHLTCVVFFYL